MAHAFNTTRKRFTFTIVSVEEFVRIFTIQMNQMMEDTFERKTRLAERFKQAGASPENNLHIIIWEGKWLVVKEGSQRSLGAYGSKAEAKKKAMQYIETGKADGIVVHQKDGSVEERKTLAS